MIAKRALLLCLALTQAPVVTWAQPTGLQPEVKVAEPTRLDWQFATRGFGPGAAKLPADYDARKQRYLLYVPKNYQAEKAWPLVLFISPGNAPAGWQQWQATCEKRGILFASPFGAGNPVAAGERTRIVLDVLDDVRRLYRVDPEQTYLAGFSGGGRMACALALALPEYVGGIIPVCGTNPLPGVLYLRHRAEERLSVAFVTGESDFNRKENEAYMQPYFQELGIRSKLWVVPKLGHGIPGTATVEAVHAWLDEDLARRRADTKQFPGLTVTDKTAPTAAQQAKGMLDTGVAEMQRPQRLWRGVALLQGVVTRWPDSAAAGQARTILTALQKEEPLLAEIEKLGGADERKALLAQARGLERFGLKDKAAQAWKLLAENHPDAPEGKEAQRALTGQAAEPARPFLGLGLQEGTTTIDYLLPSSSAAKAGLKVGDVLLKLDSSPIKSAQDLAKAMQPRKVGDKVTLEIRREQRIMQISVELSARPKE